MRCAISESLDQYLRDQDSQEEAQEAPDLELDSLALTPEGLDLEPEERLTALLLDAWRKAA